MGQHRLCFLGLFLPGPFRLSQSHSLAASPALGTIWWGLLCLISPTVVCPVAVVETRSHFASKNP